ncbi:MAG TPA: NTP transferase domain-containing protein [Candidatus Acidoferrales bacterium]|nr:NTP transferase domain-containing protein [Candidatus Acidoferrales bacterium]
MTLTCVVLAGGPRDAVAELDAEAPNKAFVPIAGRALVARTIEALRASPSIGRIVVVAPEDARAHPALAEADERRPDGTRITDSLRSGLAGLPRDELVVVAASDLPILTPAAVEEFTHLAQAAHADAVYSCVEQRTHLLRFPHVPHTWAHLRDGTYCGGGLVALRPRVLPSLEQFLERLGHARKNPLALASIFGWDILARYAVRRLTIAEAEQRASSLLAAPARAAVCTHAEIAVNVDRISDVWLADRLVERDEAHRDRS